MPAMPACLVTFSALVFQCNRSFPINGGFIGTRSNVTYDHEGECESVRFYGHFRKAGKSLGIRRNCIGGGYRLLDALC